MATKNYKLLGVPWTVAQSAVAFPLTGSTSETTLATITIPGGSMGPNGRCIVTVLLSSTNNANAKTLKVKFGGTFFANYSLASTAASRVRVDLSNRNSLSSQIGGVASVSGFGGSAGSAVPGSIDTSSDVTVLITGQLGVGTDTVTLESYSVEVVYGA